MLTRIADALDRIADSTANLEATLDSDAPRAVRIVNEPLSVTDESRG